MGFHLRLLRNADVMPLPIVPDHSLLCDDDVGAVEALMATMAAGPRLERLGLIVQEHLGTGGKRMRARLCLAATAALGAHREVAVPWAAAVEMLHNATLVHDDIQDGDLIRRGQPTVWVRHGVPQAINAGDLMLMLPIVALDHLDAPGGVCWELSRALAVHASSTVRGQAEELDLLKGGNLDRGSYTRSVEGKTGSLFALPVEGAALIAGRSAKEARALGHCFTELGVLFQLQDDVLDLYGDKGRGHRGSDLEEGKVSALVLAHLERVPEDREWLLKLLSTPRDMTEPEAVADAIVRFRESGALEDVLEEIRCIGGRVLSSPVLLKEAALVQLAREVCMLALRPIQHLLRPSL
jgi:geranylgeranyl pyrophosphate synthase